MISHIKDVRVNIVYALNMFVCHQSWEDDSIDKYIITLIASSYSHSNVIIITDMVPHRENYSP